MLFLFALQGFADTADFVRFESAKGLFKKGNVFFNNMQYLAATEYFRKAVERYPDYHTAREYLARSYRLAGLSDSAMREWENLREVSPENVAILGKIDSLRFLDTFRDTGLSAESMVFNQSYRSLDFKRFGFRHPLDIVLDGEKNLYVTSFSSGKLIKIDVNGRGSGITKGALDSKLYGIDCRDNTLAATDFQNDRFYLIAADGRVLKTVGKSGGGEGEFHGPEGICFDDPGNIYVVDSANHRVQKFNGAGRFLLQFGKQGEYEGEMTGPTDAAWIQKMVYVTDTGNKRIAVFDDSGNFIKNIEIDGLGKPRGINRRDSVLLISDERKGLCFYDTVTGTQSWFNGSGNNQKGFSILSSSVYDRDGYLYCLDYNRETVHIYSQERKRYSNLDIEITSVDTKSFPVVAYYVNIRGRDGQPVYGLRSDNFSITEDSTPVTHLYTDYLKKLAPSVSVVLCVDRSKGNEGNHGEIPWVADFLMKKMRKNDSIKLINYNSDVWEGTRFDWSRRRTMKALEKRDYAAGRSLGKALYTAVSDLIPRVNRRGVMLITDGTVSDESFASYSPDDIIHYARSHHVPIYIVSFREPHTHIRRIAVETGGAVYRPSQMDGLRSIYDSLKNSEEHRYVLAYTAYKLPVFRGLWSEVKIEVNYKGEKGHEWCGYFVP
jgi:DNA-binding beta-propeller fold protein YncE